MASSGETLLFDKSMYPKDKAEKTCGDIYIQNILREFEQILVQREMAVKVFRVSDQISADNLINLKANQFSLRL